MILRGEVFRKVAAAAYPDSGVSVHEMLPEALSA
jgi:hypothetical protein